MQLEANQGPFSSRLSGLPVGFSIPIQRGASEPNYYDSSPLDSVGPFDLPPFSMIPRYLGRAHCVLPVWKGILVQRIVMVGWRTTNLRMEPSRGRERETSPGRDKLFINERFFHRNLHFPPTSFPLSIVLPWTTRVNSRRTRSACILCERNGCCKKMFPFFCRILRFHSHNIESLRSYKYLRDKVNYSVMYLDVINTFL